MSVRARAQSRGDLGLLEQCVHGGAHLNFQLMAERGVQRPPLDGLDARGRGQHEQSAAALSQQDQHLWRTIAGQPQQGGPTPAQQVGQFRVLRPDGLHLEAQERGRRFNPWAELALASLQCSVRDWELGHGPARHAAVVSEPLDRLAQSGHWPGEF